MIWNGWTHDGEKKVLQTNWHAGIAPVGHTRLPWDIEILEDFVVVNVQV